MPAKMAPVKRKASSAAAMTVASARGVATPQNPRASTQPVEKGSPVKLRGKVDLVNRNDSPAQPPAHPSSVTARCAVRVKTEPKEPVDHEEVGQQEEVAAVETNARGGGRKPSAFTDGAGVQFEIADSGSGALPLITGLAGLRDSGHLTDAVVVSAGGRLKVHSVVLAASSEALAERLQASVGSGAPPTEPEIDLRSVGSEAAELLIRWLYGEVRNTSYTPTTSSVNEEVLRLAFEFKLPLLSELCAARLAADTETATVVSHIRLCEEYGLPRLRTLLVAALVEDAQALNTVAKDPETLNHPYLMRELLAAIATSHAMSASQGADDAARPAKQLRAT